MQIWITAGYINGKIHAQHENVILGRPQEKTLTGSVSSNALQCGPHIELGMQL